jgi:hypothetical protein
MPVTARQVIAFRLQRLGLDHTGRDVAAAVGLIGLPDFPPGAALSALAPRLTGAGPDSLQAAFERRQLVRLRAMRGAPVVVRTEDYDVFARGVLPPDEASMRAFIGPAAGSVDRARLTALEAVELVGKQVTKLLSAGPLDRDQLHAGLREQLPGALLPFCRGCDSHHAHPSLLYAVALHARLVLFPQGDGPYQLALLDRWLAGAKHPRVRPVADAPAELLRRFLRVYGPATPAEFAAWAGLGGGQPRAIWAALADQLVPVEVRPPGPRPRPRFLLAEDAEALAAADPAPADPPVRLLAPGDPLLQLRDRDTLVPDRAMQKVVWKNLGPTGLALVGPELGGVVRLQKKKTVLQVTVDAVRKLDAATRDELERQAGRLAQVRGCTEAQVSWN